MENQSSRHQNILARDQPVVTLQNTRSSSPSAKYTHLNTMFKTQASSAPSLEPGGLSLMDLNSQTVAVKPKTLFLKCCTSCLRTTSLCGDKNELKKKRKLFTWNPAVQVHCVTQGCCVTLLSTQSSAVAGIIADVNMPRSPKTADAPRHSLFSVNIKKTEENVS